MLEKIDLGKHMGKKEYKALCKELKPKLSKLQRQCKALEIPVIIVFEGFGASGKGLMINRLIEPLDPRGFKVYTTQRTTEEEKLRPFLWRFMTKTPARGKIALFDRSWYTKVLRERIDGITTNAELQYAFDEITNFEKMLVMDQTVIIKFFLHITKEEQQKRFQEISANPMTAWRVTYQDWEHNKHYEDYLKMNDEMLEKTDTEYAPWTIIESMDKEYAAAKVYRTVVDALTRECERREEILEPGKLKTTETGDTEDSNQSIEKSEKKERTDLVSATEKKNHTEEKNYKEEKNCKGGKECKEGKNQKEEKNRKQKKDQKEEQKAADKKANGAKAEEDKKTESNSIKNDKLGTVSERSSSKVAVKNISSDEIMDKDSTNAKEELSTIDVRFMNGVLAGIDLSKDIPGEKYKEKIKELQEQLALLQHEMYLRKVPVVLVFEGWDAGGKGGAIKRVTQKLDPRGYEVIPIAAPDGVERAHHYLWRFYEHFPKAGHLAIFDRSWYGRVMVERIEGFCTMQDWKRAYSEINFMEETLAHSGAVILKFWMQIDKEEQERRFRERQETPGKEWKITEEDWRNRAKWEEYEKAVDEMIVRTSTTYAPWVIVEANSKKYARIKVLKTIVNALEEKMKPMR